MSLPHFDFMSNISIHELATYAAEEVSISGNPNDVHSGLNHAGRRIAFMMIQPGNYTSTNDTLAAPGGSNIIDPDDNIIYSGHPRGALIDSSYHNYMLFPASSPTKKRRHHDSENEPPHDSRPSKRQAKKSTSFPREAVIPEKDEDAYLFQFLISETLAEHTQTEHQKIEEEEEDNGNVGDETEQEDDEEIYELTQWWKEEEEESMTDWGEEKDWDEGEEDEKQEGKEHEEGEGGENEEEDTEQKTSDSEVEEEEEESSDWEEEEKGFVENPKKWKGKMKEVLMDDEDTEIQEAIQDYSLPQQSHEATKEFVEGSSKTGARNQKCTTRRRGPIISKVRVRPDSFIGPKSEWSQHPFHPDFWEAPKTDTIPDPELGSAMDGPMIRHYEVHFFTTWTPDKRGLFLKVNKYHCRYCPHLSDAFGDMDKHVGGVHKLARFTCRDKSPTLCPCPSIFEATRKSSVDRHIRDSLNIGEKASKKKPKPGKEA